MRRRRQRAGFSLLELAVVMAIVGAMTLIAAPQLDDWLANQTLKGAARSVADMFLLARNEAIRTGDNHVVFFGTLGSADPDGTVITDGDGDWVPVFVLNDGPPATANCRIDAGEAREVLQDIETDADIRWGVTHASSRVAQDSGTVSFVPPLADGLTFADLSNNAINWVLFRPDGIPVVFDGGGGDCGDVGDTGSGGGAVYITNNRRDYGIVLSPLGGVRVHAWASSQWNG